MAEKFNVSTSQNYIFCAKPDPFCKTFSWFDFFCFSLKQDGKKHSLFLFKFFTYSLYDLYTGTLHQSTNNVAMTMYHYK